MPTSSATKTRAQTWASARQFHLKQQYVDYGMCLMWARSMANIPAKYPNAVTAARHAPRHMGTPPPGTFVYWSNSTFGHIAISAGKGYVYSTDYPKRNRVGRVKISRLTSKWHLNYLGWSDECNDFRLKANPRPPAPAPKPKPRAKDKPRPRTRIVYDSKIHPGQKNSDSVWHVQYALNKIKLRGGKRLTLSSTYGPGTRRQVRLLQAQKWGDKTPDGDLNTHQTRALFKLAKIKMNFKEKP